MRILVVDDDRGCRESLRRSLEFNGYKVLLAEDGQQAMYAVTTQRPDAMVLDMTMPKVDGLEVCRRLRSAKDDLPVLVLTARNKVPDRVAGLDAGADDYLPKPFLLEELLARLRALLRRSTSDSLGDSVAVRAFDDNNIPMETTDSDSSPIEASLTSATTATSPPHARRHAGFKIRLSSTIIGIASILVAIVGLVPPFVSAFWPPVALDSEINHGSGTARCVKIGNMVVSFANGIPEEVAEVRVGVEARAAGQGYSYWLVLRLVLTDGSVHIERTRIKDIPSIATFPLDFLSEDRKHHNLTVDIDVMDATNVPSGLCS